MARTRTFAAALGLALALSACTGTPAPTRNRAVDTPSSPAATQPAAQAVSFDIDKLGAGWTSKSASVKNLDRLDVCGGQPLFAQAKGVDGVVIKAPTGQITAAVLLTPVKGGTLADLEQQLASCNATEHPTKRGYFYTSETFDVPEVAAYTAISTEQKGQLGLATYSVAPFGDDQLRVVLTVANPTDNAVDAGLWTLHLAGEFDKALSGQSYGPQPIFGSLQGDLFGRDDVVPSDDIPPVGLGTNDDDLD